MRNRRVRHAILGYTGITDGTTRLKNLFEDKNDEEETRVRLDGGQIKIASRTNLEDLGSVSRHAVTLSELHAHCPDVAAAINNLSIPDELLVNAESWRTICKRRGENFRFINPESWAELCRRRGYLLTRQNPRGF